MKRKLTEIPQLRQTENNWHLHYSFSKEFSLDLQIKYAFHGSSHLDSDNIKEWNEYKFFVWTEGDSFQLVTNEEWSDWYEGIIQHEGQEVAEKWADGESVRCSQLHGGELGAMLVVFKLLVRHWEAMQELGLFVPSVTMSSTWDR